MTRARHRSAPTAQLGRIAASSMRNRRPIVIGILLAQVVATAANLAAPAFNARVIDKGVVAGDIGYIERMGTIMLGVAVCGLIAALLAIALGSALSAGTAADLRRRVYARAGEFSTATFHDLGTPTMLTRTSLDTSVVAQAVFLTTSIALTAPLVTIGAVALSLQTSVQLAPVIVVAAIVLGVGVGAYVVFVTPLAARLQKAVDGVNRVLREQLGGTRIIRAFGRERTASARFDEANGDLTQLTRRVGALGVLLLPGVLLVSNVASLATNLLGAHFIESGDLTIGGLTAFTGYLLQIVVGITLFIALAGILPRARASAARLSEVIDRPSGLADVGTSRVDGPLPLRFSNIEVRYAGADRPAISGVTLTCPPGKVTAIIGSTSSGKSTLVSLVPRLLDPTSGTVLAASIPVPQWDLSQLRSAVSFVGQGRSLIAGTVESNLRLGAPDADEADMWRALEAAQIAETVIGRGGLAAEVTQGGANFSGGQRQRLAIARALLRNPRILCLDAAMSALDRQTAEAVIVGIRDALPNATVILADQQVENIRTADQIAVLDRRTIIDIGTHETLLSRCEVYREFSDAQAPVIA
ncbi:ABC transporter ATP-binding protein [Gordonia sp. (in: high G+C Gram-positive bacteria)]|uniref:ABC transporter ATP-binding protein n=1 Tax=Gordonia sp. (in: high G+C Gram-positive bacteria) TaxID=84139 RepID=UPI003C78D75A